MNILYLCDRRACELCNIECYHTSDIAHARSFENVGGDLIETGLHRFMPMTAPLFVDLPPQKTGMQIVTDAFNKIKRRMKNEQI